MKKTPTPGLDLSVSYGLLSNFVAVYLTFVQFTCTKLITCLTKVGRQTLRYHIHNGTLDRVTIHLENLVKSGNSKVVREKSGNFMWSGKWSHVPSIRVSRVNRVNVTLTDTVRVSRVSVMVSVKDSVK